MRAHTEGKAAGHWLLEEARLRSQALKQVLSDRKQQMEAAARQAAAVAQADADKSAELQSHSEGEGTRLPCWALGELSQLKSHKVCSRRISSCMPVEYMC